MDVAFHTSLGWFQLKSACMLEWVYSVKYNQFLPICLCYSLPGRQEAFWKELDSVKQLWKNRHELKVEDAGIAALFGLECFAWFCAGEIVGRGFTITGYHV